MSSIVAETVIIMDQDINLKPKHTSTTTLDSNIITGDIQLHRTVATSFPLDLCTPDQEQDLKKDLGDYFDDDGGYHKYGSTPNAEAGPSSAGLDEGGYDYFSSVPVMEKGDGVGAVTGIPTSEDAMPTAAAIEQFVLEDSIRAEGGWAGWTCVAGSWLICKSRYTITHQLNGTMYCLKLIVIQCSLHLDMLMLSV